MRYRVVDTVTRFAPLGVRFWDAALARPVTDGLRLTAWPAGTTGEGTPAFRTAAGVYAFHGLPGLRDVEWGEAPTDGPGVLGTQRRFVVRVEDLEERFVPTAFEIDLPREERGVFPAPEAGSFEAQAAPGFFLFPRPERAVPATTARVFAQLEDEATGAPAAHAMLEVDLEGETYVGIADERGAVQVAFPYPAFRHTLAGSFPSGGTPLHEYGWPLTARVRWAPGGLPDSPEAGLPLLSAVSSQPFAAVYPEAPGSLPALDPVDALDETLTFGRAAVLRSGAAGPLLLAPPTSL